jgi:hypothetical protein
MYSEVPDGVTSNRWYVVQYAEDQWMKYDDATKQHCYDTWIARATPLPDIDMAVLRLIPDPLFPQHGHEAPYVEWQHCIDRREKLAFKCEAFVQIQLSCVDMDIPMRHAVESKLREYPNGTGYEVLNSINNAVLSGKVSK